MELIFGIRLEKKNNHPPTELVLDVWVILEVRNE